MKTPLFLDTETYSPINLKMQGTHKYAEHAEVIMWQYAIGDGEVVVKDYLTTELRELLLDEQYEIVIHNSHFDRTVIRHATGLDIPTSRIFDTMVCALAHSLPGALGQLCEVLEVPVDKAKDKEGKKLINLFCKPQKTRKSNDVYRCTKETHGQEWEAFRNYGRLDIEAMREVYKRMPRWNYKGFERELWELDQRINDRGVCVDLELASSAIRASSRAQRDYATDTYEKTSGKVASTNQRQALLDFIKDEFGLTFEDLKSSTVRGLLEEKLPKGVLDLLEIRLDASKTSSSKYKRVINGANADGRLRGLLQFCGAARTGRWAGRLFQPQNLPRPSVKGKELDQGIADLKSNSEGLVSDKHTVMEICSSALRGVIVAPGGKKLVIADLSNIEGRVLAWLTGETWKVRAFRDFDGGKGHDLYNLTYAKAFGISVEDVTDDQRQIGKVMELAFGYQGGIGAWITFATAYGIDLEEMAEQAADSIPLDVWAEAENFYHWFKKQKKPTYGLSQQAFIVCDSFKRLWRAEHSRVEAYWKELEIACTKAAVSAGKTYVVGQHKIRKDGAWLRIGLPSGRCLCYPMPQLEDNKISYMGVNQFTRKWSRIKTYGGKIAENITQAVARDVLAFGMWAAEKSDYEIVLTVHDEIIAEVLDTEDFSVNGLVECMVTHPIWATGLPLAAKGFETHRYHK